MPENVSVGAPRGKQAPGNTADLQTAQLQQGHSRRLVACLLWRCLGTSPMWERQVEVCAALRYQQLSVTVAHYN